MSTDRNDLLQLEQAAFLYSKGRSQEQIARMLGISQSTVSRLIQRARDPENPTEQRLRVETAFLWDDIPEERRKTILSVDEPVELERGLKELVEQRGVQPPQQIRVFPVGSGSTRHDRLRSFGESAAEFVATLLDRPKYVGVSWGSTVESVSRGVDRRIPAPMRSSSPVQFVPLCGEPLGKSITQYSASYIAARLSGSVNGFGHGPDTPSLVGVPAHIPKELQEHGTEVIEKLLNNYVEHYRIIFGKRVRSGNSGGDSTGRAPESESGGHDPVPLVRRLEMILCSVGPASEPFGTLYRNFRSLMGLQRTPLNELIVGDLCGVFLKQPRLDPESSRLVDEMNTFSNGIWMDDLVRCAQEADYPRRPGIVVCAMSAAKADPLLTAVSQGLVNVMVIDQECHDAMLRLIPSKLY